MVGEMVQNSQSLYSFTFNAIIIVHEYIYSHSTTKFLFKKYIHSHLTTYFLFTNIFTHIYKLYIHSHSTVYIRSHSRSKYWFNTVQYSFNIFCAPSLRIISSQLPLFSERKMADEGRSSGVVDRRPQTQVLHWQDLFSAALDLLEECEREWNTAEVGVRENIQIRLEYLIVALQQVLPFVNINSAVLNEILGNIRLLHGQWIRNDTSNCTNLAVYSVTSPEVFKSGSVGRPRYLISEEVLLHLRSSGFTWTKIAQMLLVSRWTLRRRIVEYGLEEITGFSMISDAQLDNLVERFMSDHGTLVGYSLVSGNTHLSYRAL